MPEGRPEPCLNNSDIVEPITREQLEPVSSSPVGKCFEESPASHDGLWLRESKQMQKRAKVVFCSIHVYISHHGLFDFEQEILREVHLSEESWELLNLPSLSAYSLRARTVCGHLFQDAGTQYNEDWIETQTQVSEACVYASRD